jgi:hypothetical protein
MQGLFVIGGYPSGAAFEGGWIAGSGHAQGTCAEKVCQSRTKADDRSGSCGDHVGTSSQAVYSGRDKAFVL